MSDNDVSELLSFFDNIFIKNIPYCCICLRTEEERRLVFPRALKKLFDVLNLPMEYSRKNLPVCYMCEAYAASVMRFHTLVMASVTIHDICHNMQKRTKFESQVRDTLNNYHVTKIVRFSGAKRKAHNQVLESEQQLKSFRSRCRLQQTEVLLIDSDGVNCSSSLEAMNNDPLAITLQNTAPSPVMETVVILDDEDEPRVIKSEMNSCTAQVVLDQNTESTPKLVPIEKLLDTAVSNQNIAALLPNQMQVLQPDKDVTSNFMLHPIVIENDGSFNIPSLSVKLVNGRLVYQEKNNSIILPNSTNSTILVGSQDNTTMLVGSNGNPTNLVGNDGSNVDNDSVPSIVIKEGSVTCLSDVENTLDKLLKDKADEMTNNYKRSCDSSNGINKRITYPVKRKMEEKESKIDWEDKIPMDVISFMDAVDPNADSILRCEVSAPLKARSRSGVESSKRLITSDLPPRLPPPSPGRGLELDPLGISVLPPTDISTQTHLDADIIDLC